MTRTIADVIRELQAANEVVEAASNRALELSKELNLALARSGPVTYVGKGGAQSGYLFDGADRRTEWPPFGDYPDATTVPIKG